MVGFLVELLRLGRRTRVYTAVSVASLLLGVGLSILFVAGFRWGVEGAFAANLVSSLLILPVGFLVSRSLLAPHFSRRWLTSLLRIGLPMVPAAFGGWFLAYANRYFLLYYGSAADVGLLAVGNKTSAPLVLFTSAFQFAWGPFAFSVQKQENARSVYAKTLTHFLTFASVVAVGVSLFAREALLIFTTPTYVAGHIVAGPMAFQIIADTSYYIVAIGLILAKKTQILAYTVLLAAVSSAVLNVMLIPRFGFFGAALANALSYGVSTLLAYVFAQREYPIPYEVGRTARLLALCITAWAIGISLPPMAIEMTVGVKLLVLAGFAAGLFLLRIVGPTEVNLALGWLRRRNSDFGLRNDHPSICNPEEG